jgi:eukaryotic-like serine/threonine-protein kinase
MATVCRADDVKHRRTVACNVRRPELAAVIGAERFLKEIETTANRQHPHLLPGPDSGAVDGTAFYEPPAQLLRVIRNWVARRKRAVDAANN